jgi:stage III sporulation protein AE
LSITDFVKILIPAYAAALGMTNGQATAAVYYEGILFVIWCVEEIFCHIALPGIELYMLMAVMNGIWSGERLAGILQSLKRGIEFLLKAVLWIVGSLGILQALITPVIDSLKWNAAKKVAGMVPGVGNISEGVSEIFVGSAILIRNGVGIFFTVTLLFLCLVPLCKIFVLAGCLKLSSALGALVNHSRMTACSDKVAEASFLLCKVLLTGMGLFLLSIAISVLAVNRNM